MALITRRKYEYIVEMKRLHHRCCVNFDIFFCLIIDLYKTIFLRHRI